MIGAPDPFGGGGVDETGAFPPPSPPAFASPPHSSSDIDIDDGDVASVEEVSKPQSSAPFEAPTGDPFGALDVEDQGPVDAGNLFAPAPAPAPASAPAAVAPRIPESSRVAPPSSTTPGADMTKLRRLETVQRVKEIGWAAGQGVLFLAFLVVAVVLGRGGNLARLAQGDVEGAFAGESAASPLGIEDTRVSRRVLASGTAIVVVTGVVHNKTDQGVPGARVDVRFGDVDENAPAGPTAPAASGWAWSTVDGVDVDALPDASSAPALSLRPPKSASLAPGDRAPFVVLAPAPPDGARVRITATGVAPATP
jgi:hypothetical protein